MQRFFPSQVHWHLLRARLLPECQTEIRKDVPINQQRRICSIKWKGFPNGKKRESERDFGRLRSALLGAPRKKPNQSLSKCFRLQTYCQISTHVFGKKKKHTHTNALKVFILVLDWRKHILHININNARRQVQNMFAFL